MASIGKIGVALVSTGAAAKISWAIGGVRTFAVLTEARIGGCVALCDLARLVADGPVQHHGRPPPIRLIQLTSGNVSRAEVEPLDFGQNGEAAGIEVPHPGVFEFAIEGHIIVVDSLRDGSLAAADAGA